MSVPVSGDDLIARYDCEVVGQLATDDRTPLLRKDIPEHPGVETAIKSAIGEVRSRIRIGQRYTDEDLNTLDEYSQEHFRTVVCVVAMSRLFRRRPGVHAEMAKAIREESDDWLRRLASGEEIFSRADNTEHLDYTVPGLEGPTTRDIEQRNFMAARMAGRHLPSIESRQPRGR